MGRVLPAAACIYRMQDGPLAAGCFTLSGDGLLVLWAGLVVLQLVWLSMEWAAWLQQDLGHVLQATA